MIEAIAIVYRKNGTNARLRLFGAPHTPEDVGYEESLKRLAHRRGVDDQVSFDGPVSFPEVPAAYHVGGLFLNLSETGSIDKAILESMASGCIPVSRNASYAAIARENDLDWLVPDQGANGVADCILRVFERPVDERSAIAERLREIVVEQHSLDQLADSVIAHLRELALQSRSARSSHASK
jgi:glycosyltransferase involved in cell wall biosynthesis